MTNNSNLHKAMNAKNDEFYTMIDTVEKELVHYKKHLKDKIVLCNCDDPKSSAFWKYLHLKFSELGLKKLVSTYYNDNGFDDDKVHDFLDETNKLTDKIIKDEQEIDDWLGIRREKDDWFNED